MNDLTAILLVLVSLVFALPLATVMLPNGLRWFPVPLLTGFGLSVGLLSLFMAFAAIAPWPDLGLGSSLAFISVVALAGTAAYGRYRWRRPAQLEGQTPPSSDRWGDPLLLVALGGILFLSIGMVLVAVYYPFVGSDAMAIYAYAARKIFFAGAMEGWRIPDMDWYAGTYPLLLPFSYVYAWQAMGEVNEYLAKIYPAAFHIATVGATYALGRQLFGHRAGVISALVLSVTPFFTRWDLYGIGDVPVTFYLILATLMVYHWLKTLDWRSAIICGLLFGLAMWTKNSATPFGAFLLGAVAFLGYVRWRVESPTQRRRMIAQALVVVACALTVAGWWYVRNWALYGYLVPARALWLDQVQRQVWNLIPLWQISRLMAPLYLVGLLYGIWRVLPGGWGWRQFRPGATDRSGLVLLLFLLLPYFLLWWYLLSYTSRYLIFVIPVAAMLSGFFISEVVWPRIPRAAVARLAVAGVIVGASVFSAYRARDLDIAWRLVTEPSQTTTEKRMDKWGSFVTVYEYVRESIRPDSTSQVLTTSGMMYAFDQDPRFVHGHPLTLSDLDGLGYLIWMNFMTDEYLGDPTRKDAAILGELDDSPYLQLVYEIDEHRVYRIGQLN